MPFRLRPTTSFAADAVLVGDPGRALLLAQELLEKPMMSNHARGLWGYTGETPGGEQLTIQSTGMGGPSAALVLADLAELGVRRVVRVGSAAGCEARAGAGKLLLVGRAISAGGSSASFGVAAGEQVGPDAGLAEALRDSLGPGALEADVASLDSAADGGQDLAERVAATDMQTVAVLARARDLGIAAAAVLIVVEAGGTGAISDEDRENCERRAGRSAAAALATFSAKTKPQVEG
jgi:purine-nucleoside phosphorylase